jgi:hypothetical protein
MRQTSAHADRHRHRIGRPDRLGVRQSLDRGVVGLENDMRAHPDWHLEHHIESVLSEVHDWNVERRTATVSP